MSTAKDGGMMFVGRIFGYTSRLIITFLLARFLGAEEFGLYNLARIAATIVGGMAILGLDTALVRYTAAFNGRNDQAGIWGTLQIGLGLTAIVSMIFGVGLYFLADVIAIQFFAEPRLIPLLQLISFAVPFFTLGINIAAATRGFKNITYMVMAQDIFRPLFRLVLILGLAISGLDAITALIIFGLAEVVTTLLLLYYLNKLFPLKRSWNSGRRNFKEILNFSLPVYMSRLIGTFGGNLQNLLLGALNTITSVGIFTVADRINLVSSMLLTSVTTAANPIIAQLLDQGDREQTGRLYQTTTKWIFTLNLPIFMSIVLFPKPILSIFGESFIEGSTGLVILAAANMVNVGTGMCGAILDMAGYSKIKFINSVIQVSLSISLNFLLIPSMGVVGAATAALVGLSVLNGLRIIQVYVLFRLQPYGWNMWKPLVAGSITWALIVYVISPWFSTEINLIYASIQVLILFIVYSGITLLLGLSPEEKTILMGLRKRATSIMAKK